jgi:hypothetical protein
MHQHLQNSKASWFNDLENHFVIEVAEVSADLVVSSEFLMTTEAALSQ